MGVINIELDLERLPYEARRNNMAQRWSRVMGRVLHTVHTEARQIR
jgi:hypothetical protein